MGPIRLRADSPYLHVSHLFRVMRQLFCAESPTALRYSLFRILHSPYPFYLRQKAKERQTQAPKS